MSKRSTKIDASAAVEEYINKEDWRINANANTSYSHASLINNLAGKAIANYWLDAVFSKEEGDAHRNGDIHIHDLDCLSPYCFTKDTKIKTVEYGDISIEELMQKGGDFTVFSFDEKNRKNLQCKAHDLRCTRKNAELVEIEFKDGLKVRCTPDHKFLIGMCHFTGETVYMWVEANKLLMYRDCEGADPLAIKGPTENDPTVREYKRVKSITKLEEREDVYCMTVECTHNFALSNGVIAHNCCGHDFQKLLDEGFNGVNGRVGSRPPKHFREALYQLANYFGILQAEWAGAQAVSSFDTYLAPYVFFDMQVCGETEDDVKKAIRNFVYNVNVPSRWGQCVSHSYLILNENGEWVGYNDLKVGDKIYVVDTETGRLKLDTVTHVNVFDAPEKMHEYSNGNGFNFCVTENHRVIHKNRENKLEISESSELLELGNLVEIPVAQFGDIPKSEYMENEFDISDDLLELTAFIITDGYIDKPKGRSPKLEWYKSLKRYGIERFEELCNNLNITYSKRIREHGFKGSKTANYHLHKCEATDRIIELLDGDKHKVPSFIKCLSPRQARIILDVWAVTDGYIDNGVYRMQADNHGIQKMLAYLAIIAGKSVQLSETVIGRNKKPTIYAKAYNSKVRTCRVQEIDSPCERVWCPTTKTGTFVCMTDEGYVFFTGNSPFTNVTIDWTVPQMMRDMTPTRGGENYFISIINEAREKSKKNKNGKADIQTAARVMDLTHAVHKRIAEVDGISYNGHKTMVELETDEFEYIFYQLTYRHFQKEMNIINRCFYEVLNEGDVLGIPFTFPIPTINITEDFDWEGENVELLFESTAKYGYSYFQNFIGSQYMKDENGNKVRNPNAYSPNDVRSMCPLTFDTIVPTNNGMKRLADLNEARDRVFYNDVWHPFRRIDNIPEQDVYEIVLDCYTSDGIEMSFKAGENHLQPVYCQQTGSYIKKTIKDITTYDFIPVERIVDLVHEREIIPEFRSVIGGGDGLSYVPIKSITKVNRQPLMCIEVNNEEHNFTLGNCIITSNCRLQLDKKQLRKRGGGLFGSDAKTGSVSVTTINCPRLGYRFKGDEKSLYEELDKILIMCKSIHEKRRAAVVDFFERGLYPYTRRYIGSFNTFFSTIGVNGVNEMIRNFTNDEHDITDEYGQDFAKRLLMYIRKRLVDFQEETGNLYNLEATPAEGTMRRFAHLDKKKYKDILQAGTDDMPFYNNSTQLPVDFTDDAFTALDLQDDLQKMYTGGCVEAGNYVVTNKGEILIEDIVANFDKDNPLYVASWNEEDKRVEWDKVVDAMKIDVAKHDKIKIEGTSNFSITTSDWHPFYVIDRDGNISTKRADEVEDGDRLLSKMNCILGDEKTELTPDLCYVLGYYIGDGSMSKKYDRRNPNNIKEKFEVSFHDTSIDILSKVNQTMFDNGLTKTLCSIKNRDKRSESLLELRFASESACNFFKKYGFTHGKKSLTVGISEEIKKNLNRENAYALLSGLIDSDGSFNRDDDLDYGTSSKNLANDMMWLCHVLGIKSYYKQKLHPCGKTGKHTDNPAYRFVISHKDLYKIENELCTIKKLSGVTKDKLRGDRPYTLVTNTTKVDVEDNTFYDLTTEKNHNYLCGTNRYVFIHNTVMHLYMRERISSAEACKNLVRSVLSNYRLPYISITPTFSICPKHGRLEGEQEYCPICDQEIINKHAKEVDTNL